MRVLPAGLFLLLAMGSCVCALAQTPDNKPAQTNETKGIPPRSAPADYQAQGKAGDVTIAAEFAGHSVPKPEGSLLTEDYVVVEAALFGKPEAHATLSISDFSLRINGKKTALPSQPYGFVNRSLSDPAWVPPDAPEKKSKSGLSSGGGGGGDSTPAPVHVPIELRRAMALYVQKSALPQGDRALPQAGLIFFQYHGNVQGIHSLELIYSGPAGNATLTLQP
jgi:hypothetical protein